MSGTIPTLPGWLPDPSTGGTAFWDGQRFTGDRRPPRRKFAAEARLSRSGALWLLCGALLLVTGVRALWTPELGLGHVTDDSSEGTFWDNIAQALDDADFAFGLEAFGSSAVYIALALGCGALGIYRLRGRGPTTKKVIRRLEAERHAHQRAMFAANRARGVPRVEQGSTVRDRFRTVLRWAALNFTHIGRAHKAFERGDHTFEADIRIDRGGSHSTVEAIEERGWILVQERPNRQKKVVTAHSDGTHTVKVSQTATFYFIRDVSLDD